MAAIDPQALMRTAARILDQPAENVKTRFLNFLDNFSSSGEGPENSSSHDRPPMKDYVEQSAIMRQNDTTTLYADCNHVMRFDPDLFMALESEFTRFEPYLRKGVQEFVKKHQPQYVSGEGTEKEFWVSFHSLPLISKVRDLKTNKIGRLMCINGTVTRTSEVRPELVFGTFVCMDCQAIQTDIEQQFKFTEPVTCKNPVCTNRTRWQLSVDQSKFVDWQRIRVQENSDEIPAGSMPRSLDVIVRHEAVERAKAGDKVVFTGSLIVIPDISQISTPGDRRTASTRNTRGAGGFSSDGVSGLKNLGVRELTYKLCFLASSVQPADARLGVVNIRDEDIENPQEMFTPEEREEIQRMKQQPNIFSRLANSIAPQVFGSEEIRKGVLLMLFGGVPKKTKEGIALRGDINACIVGDPSTAKSQFLKYVAGFLPRAVYTSGKASSAAGLTASVARDHDTGEFCIEAGALMLADNGICCIDEFDKMDIRDQVAIHEAMEQQTISIAKAGIQATLNARTSILAAANPVSGRYDKSRTLKSNVDMSPAIMSRFDLFFVLVDECDEVTDYHVATHIVSAHQKKEEFIQPEYSTAQLQRYIKYARSSKPELNKDAARLLVDMYRDLRQGDAVGAGKSAFRITVRQLESLIRLSEALARVHLDDVVRPKYVKEAERLLRKSIIHVESEDVPLSDDEEEVTAEDAGQDVTPMETTEERTTDEAPETTEETTPATTDEAVAAKKQTAIPYEKYQRASKLLVHHLLHDSPDSGMKQAELVEWYLGQDDDINTLEELEEGSRLVNLVINRVIRKDKVIIVLNQAESPEKSERLLAVSPNYVEDS